MRRKIVISLVSLILLVGVIVGVIVVVHKNTKNEDDHSNIKMKRVNQFCQAADFKDECVESLDAVSKNDSATLKDYLMASLKITGEEIKKSIEITQKTSVDNHTDPYNHMAVDDCKLLLQYAMEDLQSTQGMIEESKQELLHERVYDMLNLLSAVYSLQTICLDVIDKPEYKNPIEKGLDKAKKLSNNAINIVAKISDTFQSFNIKIPNNLLNDSSDNSSPHRRLLDANKMGDDGYPTWFPIADRKLLANSGKNTQGPHVVVAKDGSGKFNTVSAAICDILPRDHGSETRRSEPRHPTGEPRGQTTGEPRGQTTDEPRGQTTDEPRGQTTVAPRSAT